MEHHDTWGILRAAGCEPLQTTITEGRWGLSFRLQQAAAQGTLTMVERALQGMQRQVGALCQAMVGLRAAQREEIALPDGSRLLVSTHV